MSRPHHGGNLTWAAQIAGCPIYSIRDFSASINPLGIPPTVIHAIIDDIPGLALYPDPNYPRLKACLARECGLAARYIIPGNGSAELLTWAAKDLAQKNFTYLIAPAFGDYRRALNTFDSKIEILKGQIPFGELCSLIPQKITANLGLLINNPHNPTGKLWEKAEIIPYLEKFALVVVDEAFMDFLLPARQQSLIDLVPNFPNLVILRSLTKFYSLPGLRLGYAIASPERISRWQKWRDPWSVNSLAATAAIVAMKDRDYQQDTWQWLSTSKDQLWQGLNNIPGLQPLPSEVNFILVKSDFSVTSLQKILLQQDQIYIRDCLSFPELGDRYFRVAVRTPSENQLLLQALTQVTHSISIEQ